MKVTRSQLRRLIIEAVENVTWYNYENDDPKTEKLVGTVFPPDSTYRSLPHDIQQEPIPPEAAIKKPVRDEDMSDEEYDALVDEYHEDMRRFSTLRKTGSEENQRSADQLASAMSGDNENPFGKSDSYTDNKLAYDKSRAEWTPGAPEPIKTLDADASTVFGELGQFMEFSDPPIHDTILYKLHDKMTVIGTDIVRATQKLEDYLSNPKYKSDRNKVPDDILNAVQDAINDMKNVKEREVGRYFKEA